MTLTERIICTAYTSTSFLSGDEIPYLKAYAADKMGRPVDDIDMMSETFWALLAAKSKADFLRVLGNDKT